MAKLEIAYSEGPHDEVIPVYANKKLEITGKDGETRKVIVTLENYCGLYLQASVHCDCNYLKKEDINSGNRDHITEKVNALVDFSLWQLERSGIEPTNELEAEIRSTILDGLKNYERRQSSR